MFEREFYNLKAMHPLIHNITNYVTVNDVANVLLACGASPVMSDEPMEAEDITAISDGLNINIGTLNERTIEAMFIAGHKANELGNPVLLDPVGAGASRLRTEIAKKLMEELDIAVVRGNMSEIKALFSGIGTTKGVDLDVSDRVSAENLDSTVEMLKHFASESGAIIAVTGEIDVVTDGKKAFAIRNGRPEMSRITGTGCQISGLITAFVAANKENMTDACALAVTLYGIAGEIAFKRLNPGDGNMAYRDKIIDAVYNMTFEKTFDEIEQGIRCVIL